MIKNKFTAIATSLFLASTILSSASFALDEPAPVKADSRVRVVNYNKWDVVKIVGTLRTTIQIVLSDDEEITDIASGDTVAWEIAPRGNILFLKAREKNPPSNLSVVTKRRDGSRRSYVFELITRDGSIANGTRDVYFAVRFKYPNDVMAARQKKSAEAKLKKKKAASANLIEKRLNNAVGHGHKNYKFLARGAKSLEPLSIHSNGEVTILKYPRGAKIGSFYFVDAGGVEAIAEKTIKGSQVILHGVRPEIRIRLGDEILAIYNQHSAKNHSHQNTGTGTASHKVKRKVK